MICKPFIFQVIFLVLELKLLFMDTKKRRYNERLTITTIENLFCIYTKDHLQHARRNAAQFAGQNNRFSFQ